MPFDSASFLAANQAGFNNLAAGISGAAGSITKAIEKHQTESKRLKAYRAMAVDGLGLPAEDVDQMDADTLEGKMRGIAVRQQMAQLQKEEEDRTFQQAQRTAGEAAFKAALTPGDIPGTNISDDADPAEVAANMAGGAGGGKFNPRAYLAAAADKGLNLDPRVIAQFAEAEEEGAQGFKFDPSQIQDLSQFGLNGQVYVPTSKGGGQIRSNFDPSQGGIEEVLDDQGNKFQFIINPKTGARTILSRPKAKPTLSTSAQTALTEGLMSMQQDIQEGTLTDEQLKEKYPALKPEVVRKNIKTRTESNRTNIKAIIDLQHKLGSVDDEMRDSLYVGYGLMGGKALAAAKPAQGGYKIGTKYSGLTYQGGDPKQETSWTK